MSAPTRRPSTTTGTAPATAATVTATTGTRTGSGTTGTGTARARRTASAVAVAAAVTAGAVLLLSGCGPTGSDAAGGPGPTSPAATSGATGTAGTGTAGTGTASTGASTGASTAATAGGKPAATVRPVGSTAPVRNGTAHNGLTISDGSRYVVMNGTRVDFGTAVRDLAWSPDGRKAAFVDGHGDLAVSDPDGGGRVVVARNPGGQTWSHPTWLVRQKDPQVGMPALDEIVFAASGKGGSVLEFADASARGAAPRRLALEHESGQNVKPLPQTGNTWPSAAGSHGTSVYANSGTGDVYIRDDNLRQQGGELAPNASEPALSTDNTEVVFVRSVGGHDHLFAGEFGTEKPVYRDLTPGTSDYTEPVISPDGRTVTARSAQGVVSMPVGGGAAPVLVSGYHGLPAYRPL